MGANEKSVTVNLPADLHEWVKQQAERDAQPVSGKIRSILKAQRDAAQAAA